MRNLIPSFIQTQYQQDAYEGHFDALTMFVDVSGFTSMTQALMKRGHEGAEILALVINKIFDTLVNIVYERGGFVSTFAGDAFTAIFPINDEFIPSDELILHLLACVAHIQAIFGRHGIQTTPYGQFALQFKVGLSQGTVNWGIVGNAEKAYFFRGDAIDGCAASEHQADKGDVIFDRHIAQSLRCISRISRGVQYIRSIQTERLPEGFYSIKHLPDALRTEFPPPDLAVSPALDPTVIAQFFPDELIEFTRIGEFRHVVSIFLSFGGISTISELNDWVSLLLKHLNSFGGYFNRINFGDKGGFILCGFGAPVTYENTVDRALNFMLSVKKTLPGAETLEGLRFRAGITYGMAYAGIAGGEKRCEYTYHGEVVNLAARFMMKAEWGEIFVSEAITEHAPAFMFQYKGDFPYKGITEPVPSYLLVDRKLDLRQQQFTEAMIGRREELERLRHFAAPLFTQTFAGIFCIYGEAGIGKSRLAYALQQALQQQGPIAWFSCPADQMLQKPFNPFITCFKHYFGQTSENTEKENKTKFEEKYDILIEALRALSPPSSPQVMEQGEGWGDFILNELIRIRSIVGAQLGFYWKNSLWDQLDAKGKYDNTFSAIKTFFLAQSLLHPTIIMLEDGHWLDSDSLLVVESFTRHVDPYPLLVLVTFRYNEYGSKPCLLAPQEFARRKIPYEEVELREFSETDLQNFAEAHLGGPIDERFDTVLIEKTAGNPFFAEQLLHYFIENRFVEFHDGAWRVSARDPDLPDTINAVLMARIDCLSDQVKEVIKAAAVIGREFDVLLLSKMLHKDIHTEIKLAEKSRIWQALQELLYMFKHALLRDIAYSMQLKARLRELHQLAAETIETLYADRLLKWYADLAFHYEKAGNIDKAVEFLEKSGDEAKAHYHNQQALEFYDRLLIHLQEMFGFPELEIDTLLKKGEIFDLTGQWKACRDVCEEALRLSGQIDDTGRMGQARLLLGLIFRRTGKYNAALTSFEQARVLFDAANDKQRVGCVLMMMGVVYDLKNDYDKAIACYKSSLKICEELGDRLGIIKNANNMGVVAAYHQDDYETGMQWYQKSLQMSEALGEKLERSRVLSNMGECCLFQGEYDAAIAYDEQALTLAEALGNIPQIATILGNVGHVYKAQGDYKKALETYNNAIRITRDLHYPFFLGEYLLGKAEVLFSLQRYTEAQTISAEGLQVAQEVNRRECVFEGKVLSAKIDFVLGIEDAPHCLADMLRQTHDDPQLATLHYEIWKMTRNEDSRQTALTLYQNLYEHTPNIEYKTRLEEMQKMKMS